MESIDTSQRSVSISQSLRAPLSRVSLLACTIMATLAPISEPGFAGQQVPFIVTSTHTQNTPWSIDEAEVVFTARRDGRSPEDEREPDFMPVSRPRQPDL